LITYWNTVFYGDTIHRRPPAFSVTFTGYALSFFREFDTPPGMNDTWLLMMQQANWFSMTLGERRRRFNELHALFDKRILAYCIYVTGDRDMANDIYQDVFVKAYQSLHTIRESGKEANWLFRIARNQCLNAMKSRQRSERRLTNFDGLQDRLSREHDGVEYDEVQHLRDALDLLPHEYREALLLAEFEGFSLKEIAEMTGASLSNVKVRIHRAKLKLHTILEPILNDYE